MTDKEVNIYKNMQSWEEKIIQIFPRAIPNKCEWHDEIDILNILFTLCYKDLNNVFYPDGQVLSLFGVDFSKESSCIELYTEENIDIIKPRKLSFHYYDDAYLWSYFRLEIDDLSPVFKSKDKIEYREKLICLESGEYIDSKKWTNGCYYDDNNNKIELGIKDQLVNRYVHKSSLLIFAKESPFRWVYNKTLNSLREDEIAKIIEDLIVKEC